VQNRYLQTLHLLLLLMMLRQLSVKGTALTFSLQELVLERKLDELFSFFDVLAPQGLSPKAEWWECLPLDPLVLALILQVVLKRELCWAFASSCFLTMKSRYL
jgi:hypothetical protein